MSWCNVSKTARKTPNTKHFKYACKWQPLKGTKHPYISLVVFLFKHTRILFFYSKSELNGLFRWFGNLWKQILTHILADWGINTIYVKLFCTFSTDIHIIKLNIPQQPPSLLENNIELASLRLQRKTVKKSPLWRSIAIISTSCVANTQKSSRIFNTSAVNRSSGSKDFLLRESNQHISLRWSKEELFFEVVAHAGLFL